MPSCQSRLERNINRSTVDTGVTFLFFFSKHFGSFSPFLIYMPHIFDPYKCVSSVSGKGPTVKLPVGTAFERPAVFAVFLLCQSYPATAWTS